MARNGADGLVTRLRFSKLGYRMVPEVVEPKPGKGALNLSNAGVAFPIGANLARLLCLGTELLAI